MALHPSFPTSPYEPLPPEYRWFPAAEQLRSSADKLLPPLVPQLRKEVQAWRSAGYPGAAATSAALLRWWFDTEHLQEGADGSLSRFRYYFSQREAVETVIWLHDVVGAKDKFDLLRFDSSGRLSHGMFPETWPRYVLKLATGAGKTKVLSLLIAWSYFHKLYEPGSDLSRNALLVAPNIIVLDRLRADFDGLRIFFDDPVLPENGHAGRNWREDFQVTLHVQDDVRVARPVGNLFLTNIHRVFLRDVAEPSLDDDDLSDYFLEPFGPRPAGKTTDSKADLGEIIREIDELTVVDRGGSRIEGWIKLRETRPFRLEHRPFLVPRRSLFTRIAGEANNGGFELEFATFLERADGVAAFAKNYLAVGFRLDYVTAKGEISHYIPDFLVRGSDGAIWIIETKGRAELDLPLKMRRLAQWCDEATAASGLRYGFVFVDQDGFERHRPANLSSLIAGFTDFHS